MRRSPAQGSEQAGLHPAWIVILAGVSAALHVGKLPPALPVLQHDLGITLVESGFLLSLVQLASMALGLIVGLTADGIGLRRCMLLGLWLLSGAGMAGGWVNDAASLLALRAIEGLGVLLTTVAAPSMIRRVVDTRQLTRMMGFWGAFMPFGTAMALLLGPLTIAVTGWPGWWWFTAGFSALMALWVQARLPSDDRPPSQASGASDWATRLVQTMRSAGPWLSALTFAAYSGQWLAVIGFLPSLYAQSGWTGAAGAVLTALVAAVNIMGNIAAGRLLHQGVAARTLFWAGFGAMALGTFLAFASFTEGSPLSRYIGALLFSAMGGMIPATLFGLAPIMAPNERTISTTVGWMMQWSAAGQLTGPPLVAWVASQAGGWQWTWVVTGTLCVVGAILAAMISRRIGTIQQKSSSDSN